MQKINFTNITKKLLLAAAGSLILFSAQIVDAQWVVRTPMTTPRSNLAIAVAKNSAGVPQIYAIGGNRNASSQPNTTVESYDPNTNSWTSRANMPTGRHGMAAATGINGKIYVFGGHNGNQALNKVEVYDPINNTWASLPNMLNVRYLLAAASHSNGKIYLFGGADAGGSAVDTVYEFNPATGLWATKASMPGPRSALAAVAGDDGKIYVTGGDFGNAPTKNLYVYDPVANQWSSKADMPTGLTRHASASGADGKIYVMGSDIVQGGTGVAHAYTIGSDSWANVSPMSGGGRGDLGAGRIGNYIYAIAGYRKYDNFENMNDALCTAVSILSCSIKATATKGATLSSETTKTILPATKSTKPKSQ